MNNIQDEIQTIHLMYGVSEKANYEIQLLCEKQAKEIAQNFAEWIEKLSPSQRVSVWSKDGSCSGIFSMDYEQLFDKFKKIK